MKKFTRIIGTGSYLPEKIITNADLEKMVDTSDEWIMQRTGIKRRHVLGPNENTTSISEIAAKRAIEAAGIDKNAIDLIICATSTPDNLLPNNACMIQDRLGITNTQCPAFDLIAACSGFIFALSVADQYIKNGTAKNILIVGVDTLSRVTDWTDRTNCIIFADGAGAAVVTADSEPGVYSTHIHSDGRYKDLLYLSGDLYSNDAPRYVKMLGREVFKVAVTKLDAIVDETLEFNNLSKKDINWLIPHQANLRIINATAKKLDIPLERVILTIEDQGNTSAGSVPLALDTGIRDGRIKRGDIMLLEAFGAGFCWGSALIKY